MIGNVLKCSLEIQNFNSSRIKRTQFQNLIFQGLFFEEYINKILGLCQDNVVKRISRNAMKWEWAGTRCNEKIQIKSHDTISLRKVPIVLKKFLFGYYNR